MDQPTGPYLLPSILPSNNTVSFKDSLFFIRGNTSLPSPADVRRAAGSVSNPVRPQPVTFPALGLVVKYGLAVTIAEGQCLWAIRRLLPSVPVPEIYGWCQDDGQTFIYMQMIDGITLAQGWPDLDVEEKFEICMQLRRIIADLRTLRQDPNAAFIGDLNQQPLHDVIFTYKQPAGPFGDVVSFHDWFSNLSRRTPCDPTQLPNPWRAGLLDHSPIVFTHADLHRSNMMMSRDGNGVPRITAILDWHQSGWYPAPWEFYKTRYTSKDNDSWELDFVLEFLDSYPGYISWDYFVLALGE